MVACLVIQKKWTFCLDDIIKKVGFENRYTNDDIVRIMNKNECSFESPDLAKEAFKSFCREVGNIYAIISLASNASLQTYFQYVPCETLFEKNTNEQFMHHYTNYIEIEKEETRNSDGKHTFLNDGVLCHFIERLQFDVVVHSYVRCAEFQNAVLKECPDIPRDIVTADLQKQELYHQMLLRGSDVVYSRLGHSAESWDLLKNKIVRSTIGQVLPSNVFVMTDQIRKEIQYVCGIEKPKQIEERMKLFDRLLIESRLLTSRTEWNITDWDLLKQHVKKTELYPRGIIIRDDQIRALSGGLAIESVDQRCILYLLLLQHEYRQDLTTDRCLETLKEIRMRKNLSPQISQEGVLKDIKRISYNAIVQDGNKMTFRTQEIRNEAMRTFIVEFLWKSANIEFFLQESSVSAIAEYCRFGTEGRDPNELCITLPKELVELFVERLQLDIIRHPNFEQIYVSSGDFQQQFFMKWNLEEDSGKDARELMYKNILSNSCLLTSMTEFDSVKRIHMIRFVTKQHIGQRNLFVIANDEIRAYRSGLAIESVDQRCILYLLLLQHEYRQDLTTDRCLETLKEIRMRKNLSPQISRDDVLKDIKRISYNAIVQDGNKMTFRTQEIRNEAMCTFIVDFLWKSANIEFFLQESSVSAIAEYCRFGTEGRDPNELCITLPKELVELFVERLQLDIIRHPNFEQIYVSSGAQYIYGIEIPTKIEERIKLFGRLLTESRLFTSRTEWDITDWNFIKQNVTKTEIHPCDIIIIDDQIRTLSGGLAIESVDQRCILYLLLLQHEYRQDLTTDRCLETLKEIRIRKNLSPQISRDNVLKDINAIVQSIIYNSYNAIVQDGNKVTFRTQEIRNEAMRTFIVDFLWKSANIEFFLQESSVSAIAEYCRFRTEGRDPNELCITLPKELVELFVERLQLDIIRHPNFEQIYVSSGDFQQQFFMKWNLKKDRRKDDREFMYKNILCNSRLLTSMTDFDSVKRIHTIRFVTKQHIGQRNLFVIANDEIRAYHTAFDDLAIDLRCFLYCHLFAENVCVDLSGDIWWKNFTLIKEKLNIHVRCDEVKRSKKEVLLLVGDIDNNIVSKRPKTRSTKLVSNDIICDVISSFIVDCNWHDGNLEFFVKNACIDILQKFCVHQDYQMQDWEKCLFIPDEYLDLFVDRLGYHIITHRMINDESRHTRFSQIAKIPEEIFKWDLESRKRYASNMKMGKKQVFRARGMIVGCAGAGKTTLLRRLKKDTCHNLKKVKSTVGMEVFYDVFVVDENKMKLKRAKNQKKKDKTLTLMDFGGQCAYYACHQIYLTDRVFYVLVIDASKSYKDKVGDDVCDQNDTIFADWTYGDYCVFWLKSIHTYCNETCPVFIIFTHCEDLNEKPDELGFWLLQCHLEDDEIEELVDGFLDMFSKDSELLKHLDRKRFCAIEIPTVNPIMSLWKTLSQREIERRLVEVILKQQSWGETVPSTWLSFSNRLEDMMDLKMIALDNFKTHTLMHIPQNDFFDILRFYHESGRILYFNDDGLKNHIILNVQWFVDAFKCVIADRNHVDESLQMDVEWKDFYQTGVLKENLLEKIWNRDKSMDFLHEPEQRNILLLYMQRLGLLGKGNDIHYVPSMNKKSLDGKAIEYIKTVNCKSSILYFQFDFLPIFIFYRLIVSVLTLDQWERFTDDYEWVYKNIALFRFEHHCVILAVSNHYIQLQVFIENSQESNIEKDVTRKIRNILEEKMDFLTKTFHRNLSYSIGYSCKEEIICEDLKDLFIPEIDLLKDTHVTERPCPRRHKIGEDHKLMAYDKMWPWTEVVWENASKRTGVSQDETSSFTTDETLNLPVLENGDENAVRKQLQDEEKNFRCFSKLVDIGTEALRMVFDKMVPPSQLGQFLHDNEEDMRNGGIKFNNNQLSVLFPGNKTVSSLEMDISMLYKMFRNFLDIDAPVGDWGKPLMTDDLSIAADMERIRLHRNSVTHNASRKLHPDVFQQKWLELSLAIQRLSNGNLKRRMESILKEP